MKVNRFINEKRVEGEMPSLKVDNREIINVIKDVSLKIQEIERSNGAVQ